MPGTLVTKCSIYFLTFFGKRSCKGREEKIKNCDTSIKEVEYLIRKS